MEMMMGLFMLLVLCMIWLLEGESKVTERVS